MNYPVKMSQDEFLAKHGVAFPVSDYMLEKCRLPHGQTARQAKLAEKNLLKHLDEYHKKRQQTMELYDKLVMDGKIIPLTPTEKLIHTAHGHPDNASVQAARRMCKKRGIDWQTGKAITDV